MASLIIGAGVLAYDRIKTAKEKKKAHNNARFTELEKANAERISNLQQKSCFCQSSDWTGGGCPEHGYVPPHTNAGVAPDHTQETSANRTRSITNASPNGRVDENVQRQDIIPTEDWTKAPPAMDRGEIARINDERRKKNRSYKRLFTRKK